MILIISMFNLKKIKFLKNLNDHKKLFNLKKLILNKKVDPKNISGSNNFAKADLNLLKKKIKLLKLDNIVIVKETSSKP